MKTKILDFTEKVKTELKALIRSKRQSAIEIKIKNALEKGLLFPELKNKNAQIAALRAVFLNKAVCRDPLKTYCIAFYSLGEYADLVIKIFLSFDILAVKRSKLVLIRGEENVQNALILIGAQKTVLYLIEAAILKEIRNKTQRLVNCDVANIAKSSVSAFNRAQDCEFLLKFARFSLSAELIQVAEKRVERPEASLEEIGLDLSPPLGKSGVNHRLRKLTRIAQELREKN